MTVTRESRQQVEDITRNDRASHDAQADRYDDYVKEEPLRSAEAWILPAIVSLTAGVVLDVGCGTGRVSEALAAAGRTVVGVDHSSGMLRVAAQKLPLDRCTLIQADARHLPVEDGVFDAVVCSGVLHHVPDWPEVLAEAARVVRPGGVLVVREPNADYADWAFGPLERLLARLAPATPPLEGGQSAHERPLSRGELREALPRTLCWRSLATTMLLGSLGVPRTIPGVRWYYRLATAIDRRLIRWHWLGGGALILGVAVKGTWSAEMP
ncbi:MAG: class I SAM-dependent methyltransferase [Solirubrobacteraceae bacterium MAG38_C4-C5]|nr:class I SAM-dependent methyltransferase [Candidatus Siliceabacter maunaloa]